jgi:hypothetical protein
MARKSLRVVQRIYSPVHHALQAAKDVLNTGIGAIDKAGEKVSSHANGAIQNMFMKKRSRRSRRTANRRSRRSRKTRSRRTANRRSRKTRSSRK